MVCKVPVKTCVTCGGSTNRPCADGFACQEDPTCIPGPAEADCSGTCIPVCSTLTGERCGKGFACTVNPAAMLGFDCLGQCMLACGGLVTGPLQQCPDGTSCVDNPLQPNCMLAADIRECSRNMQQTNGGWMRRRICLRAGSRCCLHCVGRF
jgi:hypothetical protein